MPIFTSSDLDDLHKRINYVISQYDLYSRFKEVNIDLKEELRQIDNEVASSENVSEHHWSIVNSISRLFNQLYPDINNPLQSQNPSQTPIGNIKSKAINEKINYDKVRKPGTKNPLYSEEETEDVFSSNQNNKDPQKTSSVSTKKEEKTNVLDNKSEKQRNINENTLNAEEFYKSKKVLYAAYADLSDGFSISKLKNIQSSRHIYSLVIESENRGIFCVTNSELAQKKALDNSSFLLEKACEYANSIADGNTIHTLKHGGISLSGNVWKITKKAIIKFV